MIFLYHAVSIQFFMRNLGVNDLIKKTYFFYKKLDLCQLTLGRVYIKKAHLSAINELF